MSFLVDMKANFLLRDHCGTMVRIGRVVHSCLVDIENIKDQNWVRGRVFLGTAWRKPSVSAGVSFGGNRSHRSATKVECGWGKAFPNAELLQKQRLEISE